MLDITNPDVQPFLMSLHTHKVKYMLVGGIATVFHGHIRTTPDLDLWVQETPENKEKLVEALKSQEVAGVDQYLTVPMIPRWSTVTIGNNGFWPILWVIPKLLVKMILTHVTAMPDREISTECRS